MSAAEETTADEARCRELLPEMESLACEVCGSTLEEEELVVDADGAGGDQHLSCTTCGETGIVRVRRRGGLTRVETLGSVQRDTTSIDADEADEVGDAADDLPGFRAASTLDDAE